MSLYPCPLPARPTSLAHWLSPLAQPTGSAHWLSPLAQRTGSAHWLSALAQPTGSGLGPLVWCMMVSCNGLLCILSNNKFKLNNDMNLWRNEWTCKVVKLTKSNVSFKSMSGILDKRLMDGWMDWHYHYTTKVLLEVVFFGGCIYVFSLKMLYYVNFCMPIFYLFQFIGSNSWVTNFKNEKKDQPPIANANLIGHIWSILNERKTKPLVI